MPARANIPPATRERLEAMAWEIALVWGGPKSDLTMARTLAFLERAWSMGAEVRPDLPRTADEGGAHG